MDSIFTCTLYKNKINRWRLQNTLARSVNLSNVPPEILIDPSPILFKIIVGVSSGPVAKGVRL